MRIVIVPVLLFVVVFAGCGSSTQDTTKDGELYLNTDHGFSMSVPTGWVRKDSLGDYKDGFYFHEEAQYGLVAMQVDVVRNATLKEGVTLAALSDMFLEKYWEPDEFTRMTEGYETFVNNISAYHIVFTNTDATQTPPYNFINEQWTFVWDDELFRIQTVRLTENEDAERTLNAIMESLMLFYFVE